MLGLYSFLLELFEDGIPVPKYVGVLIIVVNCIVLRAILWWMYRATRKISTYSAFALVET